MKPPLKIVLLTLGALLTVTVGWIVALLVRASSKLPKPQPPGVIGVDVFSLMTLQRAPFYWLTLLLVIVLAGLAYRRWAM